MTTTTRPPIPTTIRQHALADTARAAYMMNKFQADIIRRGILDARARKRNYVRTPTGGIVYVGGRLYQKAYQRTEAKMLPPHPPKGPAGVSR